MQKRQGSHVRLSRQRKTPGTAREQKVDSVSAERWAKPDPAGRKECRIRVLAAALPVCHLTVTLAVASEVSCHQPPQTTALPENVFPPHSQHPN
jgi:hypothetical protein